MLDVKKQLVSTLKTATGLDIHYEYFLDDSIKLPAITYYENNNADDLTGDTLGYSNISMYVKVWAKKLSDIENYSLLVDSAMRSIGYTRSNSNELVVNNQICKIMLYRALGQEQFGGN